MVIGVKPESYTYRNPKPRFSCSDFGSHSLFRIRTRLGGVDQALIWRQLPLPWHPQQSHVPHYIVRRPGVSQIISFSHTHTFSIHLLLIIISLDDHHLPLLFLTQRLQAPGAINILLCWSGRVGFLEWSSWVFACLISFAWIDCK
jgi:hypothetical protein